MAYCRYDLDRQRYYYAPREYTGKVFSAFAGFHGQGLIIIAQCNKHSFYQDELSKRCSSGQLWEATSGIQILLLVSLELVVGTTAPQGGRIYGFIFAKQTESFSLSPQSARTKYSGTHRCQLFSHPSIIHLIL